MKNLLVALFICSFFTTGFSQQEECRAKVKLDGVEYEVFDYAVINKEVKYWEEFSDGKTEPHIIKSIKLYIGNDVITKEFEIRQGTFPFRYIDGRVMAFYGGNFDLIITKENTMSKDLVDHIINL